MATPARSGGERVPGRAAKPGVGLAGGLAGDAGLRRATSQIEEGVSDPRGPGFAVFSRGGLLTTRVGAVRLPLLRSRLAGALGWGRSPKEEGRARQRCALRLTRKMARRLLVPMPMRLQLRLNLRANPRHPRNRTPRVEPAPRRRVDGRR